MLQPSSVTRFGKKFVKWLQFKSIGQFLRVNIWENFVHTLEVIYAIRDTFIAVNGQKSKK